MTSRLKADSRQKQLRIAILRIEKGRAINVPGTKLSIAAVAKEAGVTPALIHNSYPGIADEIRARLNRKDLSRIDATQRKLLDANGQIRNLRKQVAELRSKIAKIASENATLDAENSDLRIIIGREREHKK